MNGIRIDPERLLLQRCRRGLSQAVLAREAELAYLTVSRSERDRAPRVRAITAYKLALALDVDIEALMTPPPRRRRHRDKMQGMGPRSSRGPLRRPRDLSPSGLPVS